MAASGVTFTGAVSFYGVPANIAGPDLPDPIRQPAPAAKLDLTTLTLAHSWGPVLGLTIERNALRHAPIATSG